MRKRWGVHIYSYGSDWVEWFDTEYARNKRYLKAKKKVGMEKTRKTPYRIVKKVEKS